MSKTINLGRVTAYADAVAAGYTGTREQFAQDLANAATYAAESHQSAETASAAAETASTAATTATTAASSASDDASTAHADAEAALSFKQAAETAATTATTKAGEAANSASQAATSASGAAGSATAASGSATAAAGSATAAAGSASAAAQTLVDVNAAGATQIAAIGAKGEEVLESIPSDYTTLSNDVDDLKSDLNDTQDEIFVDITNEITDWYQGGCSPSNGSLTTSTTSVRTNFIYVNDNNTRITWPAEYKVGLFVYESNTTTSYLGRDAGFISSADFTGDIRAFRGKYIKINVLYVAGGDITPSDIDDVGIVHRVFTDTSLTVPGKAADAKETGDAYRNLSTVIGSEKIATFTKTGSSNANLYIPYPIVSGLSINFEWETDGGNRQTLNLYTRNRASGANIETVKLTAYPFINYTFTATTEAAGFFLSATASGTIRIYDVSTIVGKVKTLEAQIDVISEKVQEEPFVKFGFSDIMYDPASIFAQDGEIGQISAWESKAEALAKVHAAFDALCASGGAGYGYGERITGLYKSSSTDEALFDIIAPSYVTNGVTQGETVVLDIGTDTNGDPVTYNYAYESSTQPYEVRLYKFHDTNSALHTNTVDIPKKKLLLIGGTHGNEFCAPINLYVFAKHLCTDYSNPDMIKLRSAFDVYIIPYLNGFGCQYRWNNQGYTSTGARSNGHMVDINRNCETQGWVGATGTAEQITAQFESKIANLATNTFAGPSNGSEFEGKLVKAIVDWIKPDVVIDHHHNDSTRPIYAMAYERTGGMQIYQAVSDIACSYIKNFPEYFGTGYNLFLGSTVSPASLTAKNGYLTTMTGEMGVKMSATEEMPESIAWSNGVIDTSMKATTRYSADAFETAEYTLFSIILHLCQYAMEH